MAIKSNVSFRLNSYLGFTVSTQPKFVMLVCPLKACDANLKVFTNIYDYLTTSVSLLLHLEEIDLLGDITSGNLQAWVLVFPLSM